METVKIYKGMVGRTEGRLAIAKYEATIREAADGSKIYWLEGLYKLAVRDLERERYNNIAGIYSFFSLDKEKVVAWVEERKEKRIAELKRLMVEYENAKIEMLNESAEV